VEQVWSPPALPRRLLRRPPGEGCHFLPWRSQGLEAPAQNCGASQIAYLSVFVGDTAAKLLPWRQASLHGSQLICKNGVLRWRAS
jgi:hypothetical protein